MLTVLGLGFHGKRDQWFSACSPSPLPGAQAPYLASWASGPLGSVLDTRETLTDVKPLCPIGAIGCLCSG